MSPSPPRRPPPGSSGGTGTFKVNIDAAIWNDRGTRYRIVIRDNTGSLLAAQAQVEDSVLTLETTKASSCKMGVQ